MAIQAYSLVELCEQLSLSLAQLYNLIDRGQLRAFTWKDSTFVTEYSVQEYVSNNPNQLVRLQNEHAKLLQETL